MLRELEFLDSGFFGPFFDAYAFIGSDQGQREPEKSSDCTGFNHSRAAETPKVNPAHNATPPATC